MKSEKYTTETIKPSSTCHYLAGIIFLKAKRLVSYFFDLGGAILHMI